MESKRQLPPWMLRTAATDEVRNSVAVVKRKGKGSKELPTEDSTLEVEEVTTNTDSCLVVKKSKTARSRTKPAKRAADDDGDISNKRGRDLEKESHAPPRRKRRAKVLNAVEESNRSEDELSVDDLISIAKEYVNAEKKNEGQRSKLAECESFKNDQKKNETTRKDNTTSGDSMSNVNTQLEPSSSDVVECQPSYKDVISSSSTGYLTQEILELFLGPIVKKCSEVKPNPEPVTSCSTEPDYPSSNQTQDGLEGDPIPPVKKKGSLKDRVALM